MTLLGLTNSTTDAAWVLVDDLYALNFRWDAHADSSSTICIFSDCRTAFVLVLDQGRQCCQTILEMPFRYKIFLSGGNLYYRVFEDSESYFGRYVTAPDTSAMHHVVINWEFGNQSEDISIYIDGEHVEGIFQAVEGFGNYNADIADWTIGEGLDGKLDDIRFFQSVLTLGNITCSHPSGQHLLPPHQTVSSAVVNP
ncbi:MAG: LamG-like jellyroll fold domain-containing protein [Planctomycetaceae bacterium]